ncbi:MAG TPA: carbonic anhydrase, partial [Candidatus Kapabacteria bacterium]|nr:carbonic anhydrase [Candidatus Kapabacteria bacterium]
MKPNNSTMKIANMRFYIVLTICTLLSYGAFAQEKAVTQTHETQSAITPAQALQLLKDGNKRFHTGKMMHRDLPEQVKETAKHQYPFAAVVSCMDSRTSSELVFDQGIGDIFSIRVAGNVINKDVLGSLEYAAKVTGVKLILVIGHTQCGAIKGACDNVKLGNLTELLDKIKPAIDAVPQTVQPRTSKNHAFVEDVSEMNVKLSL